jgi:hypothetical protein
LRLEDVRLFVFTPAYGGLVTTAYLHSLLAARRRLEELGAVVAVDTVTNESLVTRARNGGAARFLAARTGGRPFSHLLFLDADIGFEPGDLERLLAFGEPLVAGVYPLKSVRFDAIWERLRAGGPPAESPAVLEAESLDYACRYAVPATLRDDFIRVLSVGCGFMLLARSALERMIGADPGSRYQNDVAGYEVPGADFTLAPLAFHALFEAGVDPETQTYESEDYAFCRRWRQLGGEIWVDLRAELAHWGTKRFGGGFAAHLAERGVIARAPPG